MLKRVRMEFRPPPEYTMLTSLWVEVEPPDRGKMLVRLLHDYPAEEFAPQPGWHVEHRGEVYEIASVSGRELTVVPLAA